MEIIKIILATIGIIIVLWIVSGALTNLLYEGHLWKDRGRLKNKIKNTLDKF